MLRPAKQNGIALILCLVLMAVFFAMALYVSGKQKQQLNLFMGLQEKVELQFKAESILQQLHFSVLTNSAFTMDGVSYQLNRYGESIVLEDGVELTINSGYGLISLIPFDQDAFVTLVDNVTQDVGLGARLADRIMDWQDADSLERLNGKEASFFADNNYQPRNYSLQSLSELKLVDGVTDDLFRQLEPYLIYYKIAGLETNAASAELRRLLDLPELERRSDNLNKQVNGLVVDIQQPIVIDIKIDGKLASLHQKYFIRYWPTANSLWGYSEYGE